MNDKLTIAKSLRNKEYRDAFVEEHVTQGIALQIRAIRKSQKLTQKDLSLKIGNSGQNEISRWENLEKRPSLSSLLKLASALDVGLIVTFVPFSRIVEYADSRTPDTIEPTSYEHDQDLRKMERLLPHIEMDQASAVSSTAFDQIFIEHSPALKEAARPRVMSRWATYRVRTNQTATPSPKRVADTSLESTTELIEAPYAQA